MRSYDVVVVGGGHNALVAATLLARAGHSILVLERGDEFGGAAVSATVFPGFSARLSRYSYLVSLFPPALLRSLGVSVELRRRRISAYPPVELDPAWADMLARVAERVFPTLTEPLRAREDMRRLLDDDAAWSALFETPLSDLLERTFADEGTRGTILTDGLIGTFAPADDPLLRPNRCFLYHIVGGPWNVPVGGMGALSSALTGAARGAGAELQRGAEVVAIATDERTAEVMCADGRSYAARHVLAGVAPHVLAELLGEPGPADKPEGAQLKINMLLRRLPRLREASPEEAFTGTFHVNEGYEQLAQAYRQASAGEFPSVAPCEVYCHSLTDPSILSAELRARGVQTLTLFALHMPARLFAGAEAKERAVAATLRSLNDVLAEPIEDCLLGLEALTPPELEAELGMPGGHIFHRDLAWPFAESEEEIGRWGVETDHANVWLCGAGARRGGGVSGIPGHNAARAVLETF
ncbi:MAG: NAD(P)/FAD-dependent oxidoreductase [Solirubrobacterales bacterium]|nr:NAD(P)/FAD-dependent oxidoreductase [Solirubrobacterales bacterium]MBV9942921.1 NAD(P)/FAD-dependent oxidoreductase [Solirubrobacterales bacterium]